MSAKNEFRAQLAAVREQIDSFDEQILQLLNARAQCAKKVGEIKNQFSSEAFFYRPERESEVLRRMQQLNNGPLSNDNLTAIYRNIMSACLALEKTLVISCLGPLGSFSSSAARSHFGHAVELRCQSSIDEVFRSIEGRHCDYCVVPIENSTGGAVGRSLDLLLTTSTLICAEISLRIHQNLLTLEESLAEVHTVYSHAQSLSQCHEWLQKYLPHAKKIPVESNSLAAEMAYSERNVAAIAGVAAAEQFLLPVRYANIEDDPNNTTRFFVLGEQKTTSTGKDKTSIIVSAANRPGALFQLLQPLAEAGISMTRLESRPERQLTWQYVYFIDFEGHQDDQKVRLALQQLEQRASFFKVLGSYPVAIPIE